MNLPNDYRALLVKAYDEFIPLMQRATTLEEKLYFFSYSFGSINRVMNFFCDPLLVFIHQELIAVHQSLTARINSPATPENLSIAGTPRSFLGALESCTVDLRNAIEKDDDDGVRKILQRISNISYAGTGNGFYLYLTGKLKLE